eukprot:gb/GECG01008479.1/.p1 GENE.gb/GECG01008479.1/~~gb/GECG01008479.1/.p1  ORF type:complete len:125 (+),score=13.97 gb/GECG01008479.1/:1-375(+)
MVVHGIGVDIVQINRIWRVYQRFGARFLNRAYHKQEIEAFKALNDVKQPLYLAGRWSAKEAALKAYGQERLLFPEILIHSSPQPSIEWCGEARRLITESGIERSHVSISHDGDYAFTSVLLETS